MSVSDGTWLEAAQVLPLVHLKRSRNASFLGPSRLSEAVSGVGAENLGFSKPTSEANVSRPIGPRPAP